jgi:tetratricopeptide (TPR) repeat protein
VARAAAGLLPVRIDADRRQDLYERVVGGRGGLATAAVDATGDVVSVLAGYAAPEAFVAFVAAARAGWPRLSAVRRTAARRPRDPAALQALAETYEALASPRRAEETYQQALALAEGAPRPGATARRVAAAAHERLARAVVTRGRNLEARVHLDAYRALDPDDRLGRRARATFTEALVLFVERRLAESLRVLDQALASGLRPEDAAHALYVRGIVQHEMRDDVGGIATLERLRREHPGSRWAALAADQIAHIKNPTADHQH